MDKFSDSILVYGYGNPGRQDDGLGICFVDSAQEKGYQAPGVTIEYEQNFQLNIEDAQTISGFDVVIFVDASVSANDPFDFDRVDPSNEITFTTHAISPSAVLALCQDIYAHCPETYMLAIRGHAWDMAEGLSENGNANLQKALDFFSGLVNDRFCAVKKKQAIVH